MTDYYRRCASEGSVFNGTIETQSYGVSDSFDPAWSVASLSWCAGGTETYEFVGGDTVRLKAGAVLAIGENERYAYSACSSRPFRSSMIVFPRAMTQSLKRGPLEEEPDRNSPAIRTGLLKPDTALRTQLHAMSMVLQDFSATPEDVEEQATLVASRLMSVQQSDARRPDRLDSVKQSTRVELCKRLKRAVTMMHDAYEDSSLNLARLASEACIARHHFVRVFSAAYGLTPLRYLSEVRMEAAGRLLEAMDITATEVSRAVGYTNRSAFQRKFHQYFGMTPAAWKKCEASHRWNSLL